MTDNAFDEIREYGYIDLMVSIRQYIFVLVFIVTSLTGCSFNYTEGKPNMEMVPDMILEEVAAYRYENSELSILLIAHELEIYDKDKIWAGSDVSFVQYNSDDLLSIEAEGSAGLIIVDDGLEVYMLGEDAVFHLARDNFFLKATGLRWSKKENSLSGPEDGEVIIEKEDGSVISGTGFCADTLSYSYSFKNTIKGLLVTGIEGDPL